MVSWNLLPTIFKSNFIYTIFFSNAFYKSSASKCRGESTQRWLLEVRSDLARDTGGSCIASIRLLINSIVSELPTPRPLPPTHWMHALILYSFTKFGGAGGGKRFKNGIWLSYVPRYLFPGILKNSKLENCWNMNIGQQLLCGVYKCTQVRHLIMNCRSHCTSFKIFYISFPGSFLFFSFGSKISIPGYHVLFNMNFKLFIKPHIIYIFNQTGNRRTAGPEW